MATRKVRVSPREIRKAFENHRSFLENHTGPFSSCYLLQFYAVECGLKALHVNRNKHPRKAFEKETDPELFEHDLEELVKELRISARDIPATPQFRLKKEPNGNVYPVEQAHIAWRYGVSLVDLDERAIVAWLNTVVAYIERSL